MREVEKEFPNIYNSNGVKLENFALKSITDDRYLDPKELVRNVKKAQEYIVKNLSEYGDEPILKKPLYIHTPERSVLSFEFKGKENYSYQAIFTREGDKDGVDLKSYFIMRNESGMILKLEAIKNGEEYGEFGSQNEPVDTDLFLEVEEIKDFINASRNNLVT